MSFLQSAINQVGRDMGRVVSNTVLGDRHAIKVQHVNQSGGGSNSRTQSRSRDNRPEAYKEFDKSLKFANTFQPKTLINKLTGCYVALKNFLDYISNDDHIDVYESFDLMSNIQKYTNKIGDIVDVLEVNPDRNKDEIDECERLFKMGCVLFTQAVNLASESMHREHTNWKSAADLITIPTIPKVWLNDFFFYVLVCGVGYSYYKWQVWWPIFILVYYMLNSYSSSSSKATKEKKEHLKRAQEYKGLALNFEQIAKSYEGKEVA